MIGWKHDEMVVNISFCSSQIMHLEVTPSLGAPFFCSFDYGANNKHERRDLLHHFKKVIGSCSGPWIILGDFNCIANFNERIGKAVRLSEVEPLRSCIANCDIHDMKSTGHFYTWNNKQEGGHHVFSKIDRAMCNAQWDTVYPNAEVVFLPERSYDHSPILVQFYA